jgi:protein-S-isoprenylcysteine O-methyltransferase Ste14
MSLEEDHQVEDAASWIEFVPITLVSVLFILQMIIGIILLSDITQNKLLAYAGVGLYAVSGVVFGYLPVLEFRRKGEVAQGDSYIKTTRLVDTGVYSIVRHPQYMTFILWGFAGMLLFQHWIIVLLGIPIIPLTYIDMVKADRDAIRKLGDENREYMLRVPRTNFLLGLTRRIRGR